MPTYNETYAYKATADTAAAVSNINSLVSALQRLQSALSQTQTVTQTYRGGMPAGGGVAGTQTIGGVQLPPGAKVSGGSIQLPTMEMPENVTRQVQLVQEKIGDITTQTTNTWKKNIEGVVEPLKRVTKVTEDFGSGNRIASTTIEEFGEKAKKGGAKVGEFDNQVRRASNSITRHLRIVAEAIIIYESFRIIQTVLSEWVQVHREMDWAMTQFRISTGATREELALYSQTVEGLAFATGTQRPEVFETATLAARLRRPELAVAGTQVEMLFGTQSTEAVRDLFAIQQQFREFGVSLDDIMNNFARLIQAGGLSGSEILDISETWGAFSRQFNEDLEGISSLFVALGTVLGETGGSLEVFMRHLERFYTDDALRQMFVDYTGIQTVTGPEGYERREPMTNILRAVSQLTQQQIGDIAEFMPQELGQKSRQFFNSMISQWDIMEDVIERARTSTYTWQNAVEEASQSFEIAARRIGVAWQNLLAAIGNTEFMRRLIEKTTYQLEYDALTLSAGREAGFDWDAIGTPGGSARAFLQGAFNLNDFIPSVADLPGLLDISRKAAFLGIEDLASSRVAAAMGSVYSRLPQISQQENVQLFRNLAEQFLKENPEIATRGSELRQDDIEKTAVLFSQFVASETGKEMAVAFVSSLAAEWMNLPMSHPYTAALEALGISTGQGGFAPAGRTLLPYGGTTRYTSPDYTETAKIKLPKDIDLSDVLSEYADLAVELQESLIETGFIRAKSVPREGLPEFFFTKLGISDKEPEKFLGDVLPQELIAFMDEHGTVVGVATGNVELFGNAISNLTAATNAAAQSLFQLQGVTLPSGLSFGEFQERYAEALPAFQQFADANQIELGKMTDVFVQSAEGMPVAIVEGFSPVMGVIINAFNQEEQAAKQAQNEADANAKQALARAEARHREAIGVWESILNKLPGVTKATPVTDVDYLINRPAGTYVEKWDENVRQLRADVNNILGGRPTEYGIGTNLFPDIFTPEIMGFVKGADLDTQRRILMELQGQAEEEFYNLERPWPEYEQRLGALVPAFQQEVEKRQTRAQNLQNMQDFLATQGFGVEQIEAIMETFEPPFKRIGDQVVSGVTDGVKEGYGELKEAGKNMRKEFQLGLTGVDETKTSEADKIKAKLLMSGFSLSDAAKAEASVTFDEITSMFDTAVSEKEWASSLSSQMMANIDENVNMFLNVGSRIGDLLVKSSSSRFASAVANAILEEVLKMLNSDE